jgi:signal transduction histidine kinase
MFVAHTHFSEEQLMISATLLEPFDESTAWSEVIQDLHLDAIRKERRRFSNELHDVVANHLNSATLFLDAAKRSLPTGEVTDLIDHAEAAVRNCWSDARRCAEGLRSVGFDECELSTILSDYAGHLSKASGVAVNFAFAGTATPISDESKLAIVRITQEAVTNAIRHAHASSVSIELGFAANGVGLSVSDNGCGFNTAHISDGIGMQSMRDRAQQVGAEFAVMSGPMHGTQIVMTLPAS